MSDNVNIIVQDTINEIVVNTAVVVDTIDINVQTPIDEVTIITNPNNYIVNINRIIGEQVQSDWNQNNNQEPDYIKNKPTIPAAQVNSDWNAVSGVAEILNKPTIPSISGLATVTYVDQQDALKVDKVTGYGLSQNDFTNTLKTKLDGIQDGAEVNVNADWNATSGDAQILNKPTIPAAQVNSDWNATSGVAEILNKPTIPSLTGYVPYTGATDNLDLGTYNLTADHIALNVSPSGAGFVVGATEWNNTIGSSQTLLKGGNVSLKNGVDLVARIVNKVVPNTTLTKANYQVVRVSGASGQRLAVDLAQANNDNNSADTLGVVIETIATNQEGFIMTVGQIENINTTGSLQGETWADGDVLYLSPTTAGKITNVKPNASNGHIVVIGYVEYAHAIHGAIYIKIMNGWELDELHNVYISSVADKQLLSYDSATSLWKNKSVTTAEIADSTNKRYVTDANLTTISNQSGTNTGDETTATIKTKLGAATTSVDGYLTSANWTTFNAKQNALLDIASVQDNGIYSTFMNGAICYFLGGIGAATFNNLRISSNNTLSGNSAYFSNNAVQFSTTAVAGTLAFQRGVPFYHSGRSLLRFQPNIVSSDARYFVGLSNLYQVTAPTNVEPTTLTQTIGVAKLSTSANLFIIHNDGTGTATSVDLGVNYPATSNLYIYDIKIFSTVSAYTGVTVRRTTISTGATISTDYAVTSNFPSGVAQNPALWITNNASAVANSLYHFGAIGYNTTI